MRLPVVKWNSSKSKWKTWTTFRQGFVQVSILRIAIVVVLLQSTDSTWWSLSQVSLQSLTLYNSGAVCDSTPGLVGHQRRLCHTHQDLIVSVARGASQAIKECQHLFSNSRWNCSTFNRDSNVFGKVALQAGNRETAILYAITSGAVVHSITRSCSKGDVDNCACDQRKVGRGRDRKSEFVWGGCSDNIRLGIKFTRMFVDAREKVLRDARALMNLHNNGAGRRAVRRQMKLQCKCHGVSGSCTTRTCWLALQDFRFVGTALRTRYNGATQVMMGQEGNGLIVADRRHKKPTRSDLVYLEDSPDYCVYNPKLGSLGTAGRRCKKSSLSMEGCDIMCCGRGYDTTRVQSERQCECKFHWCCAVKCKVCYRWENVHTCKGATYGPDLTADDKQNQRN